MTHGHIVIWTDDEWAEIQRAARADGKDPAEFVREAVGWGVEGALYDLAQRKKTCRNRSTGNPRGRPRAVFDRATVAAALASATSVRAAARALGASQATLFRWLEREGLPTSLR